MNATIKADGDKDLTKTASLRKEALDVLKKRRRKWLSVLWITREILLSRYLSHRVGKLGEYVSTHQPRVLQIITQSIRDSRRPKYGDYRIDSKSQDGELYYRYWGKNKQL